MKTALFLLALIAAPVAAQLLTIQNEPAAQRIARQVAQELNSEFDRRIYIHKTLFNQVWNNKEATPDAILAALGNQAVRLFQLSAENIDHIDRLATILGKDVADFIPAAQRVPPRAVTMNANGTVTLAPN